MRDILIVEDSVNERQRLFKLFSQEGYAVTACESVSEAESFLQHETYRLAILDIGLSDKSGSHLFNTLKRGGKVPFIIIFTGNPSVHLKQRFIEEGAVDYIVKASPQAQNDQMLGRIKEIIGDAQVSDTEGIDLQVFLNKYVLPNSRKLFLDDSNSFPACQSCKSCSYKVIFSHQAQLPPDIAGKVICAQCEKPMDPDIE